MPTSKPLDSIALLTRLIAFPTVSRTPNDQLMALVQQVLADAGIASRLAPDPQDVSRCNLFATVGPLELPGLLLSGHTDVVPAQGQAWSSDPFEARIENGLLYGRGSADMKGFVACAVLAMCEAAKRHRSAPLKRPMHLALSFDEEIGCVGVRHLLTALADELPAPALCLVGEPTLMQIGTGHKGKAAYRALCCGQEGHSGMAPLFHNAIHAAADCVAAMRDIQDELAQSGSREDGYLVPYTTVHAGTIHGGRALNIVPGACEIEFEIRNVTADAPEHILARIQQRMRERISQTSAAQTLPAMPEPSIELVNTYPGLLTAETDPSLQWLASALPAGTPLTKVAFGTEGGLFANTWQATSVLVCGPGSIEVAHKADEYVALEQIQACEQMLARLLQTL